MDNNKNDDVVLDTFPVSDREQFGVPETEDMTIADVFEEMHNAATELGLTHEFNQITDSAQERLNKKIQHGIDAFNAVELLKKFK